MDVRDETAVEAGIAEIVRREGRVDIAVNNAGIGIAAAIEDTPIDEARDLFEINFFGVMRVCRAVLPIMRTQGSGYIVNIGSIGGLVALPFQGIYSASKFALEALSEALRTEAGPLGVRVVLIEPGEFRTGFTQNRCRTSESMERACYRERCDRAVARMEGHEQHGAEAEKVAQLLYKVINQSKPRLRYTVGRANERAAVWLKRLMPYSVVQKIIGDYYS